MIRVSILFCSLLAGLAVLAPDAAADEVFILDNGTVLRGHVMREDGDLVTLRLAGIVGEARVTLRRNQIARRIEVGRLQTKVRPAGPSDAPSATSGVSLPQPSSVDTGLLVAWTPPTFDPTYAEIPAEEPSLHGEGFFDRFSRVAKNAIPASGQGQIILSGLLLAVIMTLISVGTRFCDLSVPSIYVSMFLGVLLGGAFVANILYTDSLLRADRALWVVPCQIGAWIVSSRFLLGGSMSRVVLLLGFVVSSLMAVVFVTGAVLVIV